MDLSWQSRVLGLHLHPCSTKGQADEAFPSEQISQLGLDWRECLCLDIHINVAPAVSSCNNLGDWECTEASKLWRTTTWCCSSHPLLDLLPGWIMKDLKGFQTAAVTAAG